MRCLSLCQLWLTSFFHVCLFVYLLTCLLFLSLFPFFPCFLLLQSQSFPSVRNFSPSGFYLPLLWLCLFVFFQYVRFLIVWIDSNLTHLDDRYYCSFFFPLKSSGEMICLWWCVHDWIVCVSQYFIAREGEPCWEDDVVGNSRSGKPEMLAPIAHFHFTSSCTHKLTQAHRLVCCKVIKDITPSTEYRKISSYTTSHHAHLHACNSETRLHSIKWRNYMFKECVVYYII